MQYYANSKEGNLIKRYNRICLNKPNDKRMKKLGRRNKRSGIMKNKGNKLRPLWPNKN